MASEMKIIGNRVPKRGDLAAADGFLKLVIALRGNKPFIPRGVHRFRSFEEAQTWSLKMMTRKRVGEEE